MAVTGGHLLSLAFQASPGSHKLLPIKVRLDSALAIPRGYAHLRSSRVSYQSNCCDRAALGRKGLFYLTVWGCSP